MSRLSRARQSFKYSILSCPLYCTNYPHFIPTYEVKFSVSAMWRNQFGIFLCKMTRALVLLCMAIILPLVRCHKVRSQSSIVKTPKDIVIPCNYLFKTKNTRVRARVQEDNSAELKRTAAECDDDSNSR